MKIKSLFTTILLSLCMVVGGVVLINKPVTTSQNYNVKALVSSTIIENPDQFTYRDLDGEEGVEITGFKNVTETLLDVKFPSLSDSGKTVTRIADNAFADNANIYSITIPTSIKVIGDYAFYKCENLTTLNFDSESQLEQVGSYAFACGKIPDEKNDNESKIVGNKIASIQLPKSVEIIGDHAFYNCTYLAEFTFEDESNLTTIGSYAFSGEEYNKVSYVASYYIDTLIAANQIETFNLPKNVVTIEDHAFYNCSSLTNFTFETGSKLTTIGSYAFSAGKESKREGSDYMSQSGFSFKVNKISTIEIPKSVTIIKDHAFYNCGSLANLTFEPDSSLETIESYAFGGENYQRDFRNIAIPASTYAVIAPIINKLTIPRSVKTIEDHAFYLCTSLKELTFEKGSSLQEISPYSFGGGILTKENGYGISYNAYKPQISSLEIPRSVKTIGDHAFYMNTSLTNLTFEDDSLLTNIGDYAFAGGICEDHDLSQYYAAQATAHPNALTSLKIPKSVTAIGDYAFYLCGSLAELTFENDSLLESIGSYAFGGNTYRASTLNSTMDWQSKKGEKWGHISPQISSLKIPKSVTTIEDHAFYLSSSLSDLTFEQESSLQTIGSHAFSGAVYENEWVNENPNYNIPPVSSSGINKLKNTEVLTQLTAVEIPKSVTTIGDCAFYLSSSLSDLTFESGSLLESIGSYAFAGEQYIEITPNEDNVGVGNEEFHDVVPQISSLQIPKSVTQIGAGAFKYNKLLSTLTFEPQSQLLTIEEKAFENCSALSEVMLPGSVATLGRTVFDNAIQTIYLDSKSQYDALSANLSTYSDKVTYQITITYKENDDVKGTDYKLWKRGLDWAKVEGVWKSGQEFSLPEGRWRDADKQEVTVETLGQKLTSGEIDDNITLTKRVIVYRVESDIDGIYATSVEGFDNTATLEVEEITDTEKIQQKLGDKYSENIVRMYVVELRDGGVAYDVSDLNIHLGKNLVDGNGVYLFKDSNLTKQKEEGGEFTFDTTSCTIVLRDDTIRVLDNVTAELTEGFPEDVTLSVIHYTIENDEDDIKRELGKAYIDLVEEVYVIELKLAGVTYPNEDVTITIPDTFGEGFVVKILESDNFVAWTLDNGKYTHKGTKLVVALLNKIHRIESNIEGIYAISEEGFEEATQLKVTEITDVDQIKTNIGEDLYNENIQKIYVIEIVGITPVDYKIFITKDCAILGDKFGTLEDGEIVDVTIGDEDTLVFENKIGTTIVSKNPTVTDPTNPDNKEVNDKKGNTLWWIWLLVAAGALVLILVIILLIWKRSKKEDDDEQKA